MMPGKNQHTVKKRRVNLRLNAELAEWAFDYALRQDMDLTALITRLLCEARRIDRYTLEQQADAEQI